MNRSLCLNLMDMKTSLRKNGITGETPLSNRLFSFYSILSNKLISFYSILSIYDLCFLCQIFFQIIKSVLILNKEVKKINIHFLCYGILMVVNIYIYIYIYIYICVCLLLHEDMCNCSNIHALNILSYQPHEYNVSIS